MSFLPKDLSPAALAHLGNLHSILRELTVSGTSLPAHHVDMDPAAYEAALAWARATAAETAAAGSSPAPGDKISEDLFVATLSMAPLSYQEFAFYVGLLEDALTIDAPWAADCLTRADELLQSSLGMFDFKDSLPAGDAESNPTAVLLLMYLRYHALISAATEHLSHDDIASRCAAATAVVLSTSRPPAH